MSFLPAAIVLSAMSALGACGASGVAGGSLLLIPMACSLFGISNDIAMQMVGVGFIIGVVQDSVETALNSAGDVEFAATAEYHQWLKEGKPPAGFPEGLIVSQHKQSSRCTFSCSGCFVCCNEIHPNSTTA